MRLTLLAVLCWTRASEITDALVELLIGLDRIAVKGTDVTRDALPRDRETDGGT